MYVVSVVPQPAKLLEELHRVCRPDGEIFIVNHFQSENPIVGRPRARARRVSSQIGFNPDLDLRQLVPTAQNGDVSRVNFFWRMVRLRNGVSHKLYSCCPRDATPPEIIFHDVDRSPWVESYILERMHRLEKKFATAARPSACRSRRGSLASEGQPLQRDGGSAHAAQLHDLAARKTKVIGDMPAQLPALINLTFGAPSAG